MFWSPVLRQAKKTDPVLQNMTKQVVIPEAYVEGSTEAHRRQMWQSTYN